MTSPDTLALVGPVNVKVEALIVKGFIASLNLAETIVLVHAPLAPVGATEITVGGARPGASVLSGSLHPLATRSNRNVVKQIVELLYLCIIITFLLLGPSAAVRIG